VTLTEFDLRLASHLGITATELKSRMPHREYLAWRIKDGRWPIGERRNDFRFALLTAAVKAVFGGEAKVEDFLPVDQQAMTDEQIKAAAQATATGGERGSQTTQG
jgi:hypothetical protein